MILGNGNQHVLRSEIINIFEFIGVLSASPNLNLFLASSVKRKQITENDLWATVFSLIMLLGRHIVFWLFVMQYPTIEFRKSPLLRTKRSKEWTFCFKQKVELS